MIPSVFIILIGIGYAFAPEIGSWPGGPETVAAHIFGPLIFVLAAMSRYPSFSFLRHVNAWLAFALALSPLIFFRAWPTALVVQAVTGLWVMGFSMLSETPREGGGWRRTLNAPVAQEEPLEWS